MKDFAPKWTWLGDLLVMLILEMFGVTVCFGGKVAPLCGCHQRKLTLILTLTL